MMERLRSRAHVLLSLLFLSHSKPVLGHICCSEQQIIVCMILMCLQQQQKWLVLFVMQTIFGLGGSYKIL